MSESIGDIKRRVRHAQRMYGENVRSLEKMLKHERGCAARKPYDEDVVVLCSGGLDSSVMIDMVIREYSAKVHPLFIKRGARAERHEEAAFDFFMQFYGERFPRNVFKSSKLVVPVPPPEFKEYFPKELSQTIGLPLRNSTLENFAVMYAVALNGKYGLNIRTVLTGSVGDDSTEPELGLLSLRSQTVNTCIQMGDWEWQITSPLIDPVLQQNPVYKGDLIVYAREHEIPLDKTRSCFSDVVVADGTCGACQKRLKAFETVGMKDPIKYEGR